MSFHGVKWTIKTWFYDGKCFIKIWRGENFSFQNITRCIFFESKNRQVVKFVNQNLTSCKIFISKPDALESFFSKSDKFQNFFSGILFLFFFQVLTEWWYLLSTLIPTFFKVEKWKTMSVMDLVAWCTIETGTCQFVCECVSNSLMTTHNLHKG